MSKPDNEVRFFDNGIFPPMRLYHKGQLWAEMGTKTMNDFEKVKSKEQLKLSADELKRDRVHPSIMLPTDKDGKIIPTKRAIDLLCGAPPVQVCHATDFLISLPISAAVVIFAWQQMSPMMAITCGVLIAISTFFFIKFFRQI